MIATWETTCQVIRLFWPVGIGGAFGQRPFNRARIPEGFEVRLVRLEIPVF